MAINATDVSVAVNGDIRWTGGATPNYTVLELHRFLQGLADDAQASGDDLVDITSSTPSERSTDNIITLINSYNIDDTMAEHLYNGSITQDAGDTVYSGLQVLGAVNNSSTQLMIIQDNGLYQFTTTPSTPFWGTQSSGGYNGNAAAGILMQLCIKTRVNGADIDGQRVRLQARHWGDTYDFFNVSTGQGVSVAALGTTPDAQNTTTQGTVTVYTDVLNSGGTANAPTGGYQTIDLNNGAGPQPYYSQWTFGARNLKAIWEYTKDLTGNGTAKTVDSLPGELFLGITHDLNFNNQTTNFTERETVVWGTKFFYNTLVSGPFTPGNYVTIGTNGAAGRVMYDDGVDELIVALEDTSITLVDTDVVTEFSGPGAGATSTTAAVNTGGGATVDNDKSGGSGIALAVNDAGATGDMWIQLLTGSAPVASLPLFGVTSGGDGAVSGSPVSRTIPKIFTGSYTGTYIGAFGIGIDANDLTAADTIQDLLNVTQTPPNNVTFTVSGLVTGEDRVLVGPRLAGVLDKAQLSLNGALSSGTTTSIIVNTPGIPAGTPATGAGADSTRIRVQLDTGVYREQEYSSYSGDTFTIPSTDYSSGNVAADNNEVFLGYIDKLITSPDTTAAYTAIYTTDVDLLVRVRDGGSTPIKTFEAPATFGSSNTTVAAIRTSDA
jgi:hypothetical protein